MTLRIIIRLNPLLSLLTKSDIITGWRCRAAVPCFLYDISFYPLESPYLSPVVSFVRIVSQYNQIAKFSKI